MNEERKRILEMISDGTITPSEGARLLEALGSSSFSRERQSSARRKKIIDAGAMLSEIGPMIQETMGDIFRGSRKSDGFQGMEFQETDIYEEELPHGDEVIIHGVMKSGGGISVSLSGGEGNMLKASIDGEGTVGYSRKQGKTVLQWKEGDLSVTVPSCARSVRVVSRGGAIGSEGVAVPLTLNTMGGGISIIKPGSSFSAKTMGGNISIVLDSSWNGSSRAKSMGGGITVAVEDAVPVIIEASTLGGTIDPGTAEHTVLSSSGGKKGGAKMSMCYGEEEDASRLSVSTMGGSISIKEKTDE